MMSKFSLAVSDRPVHQELGCVMEVKIIFLLLRDGQKGLDGDLIWKKNPKKQKRNPKK